MTYIGIMQGRLTRPLDGKIQAFPRESWAEEFPHAAASQLDCIEWIYDCFGEDVNPLATSAGIVGLKSLAQRHGVAVRSVCADYFMERPLLRISSVAREERLNKLKWLIGQACELKIQRIVLPFVDQSAIGNAEDEAAVVDSLKDILPAAEACDIELHLETSLDPQSFRALLSRLPHPLVKVNYDSGNSASLGYRSQEEFAAYGERIGSVHIKDRVRGGSTVALGTGDTDFSALFSGLRQLNYQGDFILQVARESPGDEVAWAQQNRAFVLRYWGEAR
ncbi:MAG: sugar phosphate isomerase/epimerase family protein [Pyrinomonadaceae bacterium]